jgi:hypothetical protein
MEKTPLQRHLEETPDKPIIGLKLKDLKMWLQHLPNEFLEYPLLVAQQGVTVTDLIIYDKQYVIRGFDVDTVDKQILFLHAIDDYDKIITVDTTPTNE